MSYILEALRKSEKKRKQDEVPTLDDVAAPRQLVHVPRKSSSSRLFQGMFGLLLLLALVLGGIVARDRSSFSPKGQDRPLKKSQVLSEIPAKKNSLVTERPQEKPSKNPANIDFNSQKNRLPKKSAKVSPSVIRKPTPPRLAKEDDNILVFNRQDANAVPPKNLPLTIRDDLRNMRFAGHAYSPDPALRLIMINNKILHEGESVDADLRLSQITENGIILAYHDMRIRINLF